MKGEQAMNLVAKVRDLEEALCQVNEKLSAIEDACEQEIIQSEEAVETVTDGSEGIHEGRVEFAEQILNLVQEDK